MMIPLEVKIDRIDKEDPTKYEVGIPALLAPPTYRVKATLLDTENRRAIEYEFHSMVDWTQTLGQEIGIRSQVDMAEMDRECLIKLRDELNLILGE